MRKTLKDKIEELNGDIEILKDKMRRAYTCGMYVDGNFYYKMLVEREKILSSLKSKLK